MLEIFNAWKSALDSNISNTVNIITIILVLFIIISVIGYFISLIIYLKRQNIKLNQTIQMLNMIPITMLPKSRKDVRDFFIWIIK